MIADDPAGGALLDQQANRELDQIIHATLSANRDQLHVVGQLDFRSQPDVWVDDQATRAWMRGLYEARFRRGLSTADTVCMASVTRLQKRRENRAR